MLLGLVLKLIILLEMYLLLQVFRHLLQSNTVSYCSYLANIQVSEICLKMTPYLLLGFWQVKAYVSFPQLATTIGL